LCIFTCCAASPQTTLARAGESVMSLSVQAGIRIAAHLAT